jgi:hypothetical protein
MNWSGIGEARCKEVNMGLIYTVLRQVKLSEKGSGG